MKRLFTGVVVALLLCAPAFCQDARLLQKLSEHVYAYVGVKNASPSANSFGANCGVIIGSDAVMVVDTLISAREAEKLLADIRRITDKPVKYVVNTHYHLDHAWGNSVFVEEGAVVIAHENSRLAAARSEYGFAHYKEFGLSDVDMQGTFLAFPTVTFKESMFVDLGGVQVGLLYPGASHTDGSITVFVPQDRVLFAGDILFTGYHPYLGEGDIPSWLKVLSSLERTSATQIIPGHGPVSTLADIKAMEVYLKEFDSKAKKICKGKKQEDAPALAQELLKELPQQGRAELPSLIESNLREKYLPAGSEKQH